MTRPQERTLTALLSTLGRGEGAELPLLIACGRAEGPPPPWRPLPVGAGVEIGRGGGAPEPGALLLDDPLVSGRHARIAPAGSGFELTDLGSKNGTFLDGQRLSGPGLLADGARIFVGNHAFVFRRVAAADLEALDEERTQALGPVA